MSAKTHRQHAADLDAEAQHVDFFREGAGIPSRTVLIDREALGDARFDESLPVREDPELWTRLLAKCDAERVDEALAIKHRRDDSITSDPEQNLEAELQEIDQLCTRFPELEAHRDRREMAARFRYGRHLLRAGDADARRALRRVLREYPNLADYRVWACYVCAWLPGRLSRYAFGALERLQEVAK
jgi:hypothetical protein